MSPKINEGKCWCIVLKDMDMYITSTKTTYEVTLNTIYTSWCMDPTERADTMPPPLWGDISFNSPKGETPTSYVRELNTRARSDKTNFTIPGGNLESTGGSIKDMKHYSTEGLCECCGEKGTSTSSHKYTGSMVPDKTAPNGYSIPDQDFLEAEAFGEGQKILDDRNALGIPYCCN